MKSAPAKSGVIPSSLPEQLSLLQSRREAGPEADRDALTIRPSRRARQMILRVVPPHGMELVVPRGTRPAAVEAFCRQHAEWIARTRAGIRERYRRADEVLPRRVRLAAVAADWQVVYRSVPAGRPRYAAYERRLEIATPDCDVEASQALLRAWLRDQAKIHLPPWVHREAGRTGAAPAQVQIRQQRTRWGSCSARGTISLNASALLLQPAVARYLLIHELCHLGCLNHSARFWRRVERVEPDFAALDRRLSEAWREIPLWALPR